MSLRFQRLIGGDPADLPEGLPGLLDDLRFLKERRGEKIVAVEEGSEELVGAIGLHPERDEGGLFYRLSGIEVAAGHRQEGLEEALLVEAEKYLRAARATRLKFGTSPLLTAAAELYVTRFGAHYRWREGARTADRRPWPYVTCECDFDNPLARPLDLRDEEVAGRSVLDWSTGRPSRRPRVVYAGPLAVLLPDLARDDIARAAAADASFLPSLYDAFHELFRHGYGFAWFDRLPPSAVAAGGVRFYYVMNRLLAL
jgi:hypothetical protein